MDDILFPSMAEDRSDSKWSHPLCKDAWIVGGLAEAADMIFTPGLPVEQIIQIREHLTKTVTEMLLVAAPEAAKIINEWTAYTVPGLKEEENAPDVPVKVIYPDNRGSKLLPVVFYVYAGGLVMGSPEMSVVEIKRFTEFLNCAVVVPSYRLAPENKYPSSVNDLRAAYKWMVENAAMLGIDTDRIIIQGGSSGGHLGAALTHRLKRFNYINGIMPRAQVLEEPVLDDRQMYPSNRLFIGGGVWDSAGHHRAWLAWLGDANFNSALIGPEAVPGHAIGIDFKDLPPAYIYCMESDPDRDGVIAYASGLMAAGVFCELHVTGGSNHMSIAMLPGELQERHHMRSLTAMRDAFTYDLRRPWIK